MRFIDTHSHIYLDAFNSDRPETILRAADAGVKKIYLPNIDSRSVDKMNSLADEYPELCYPMMGLHPTSVKNDFRKELLIIDQQLEKGIYHGVGETGIDLYWDKTYKEQQAISFRHHLELALKFDLPVVIHCRESYSEVITIVNEYAGRELRGIFHAFSGNTEQASEVIALGFKIGIGGVVTYKKSGLAEVVKKIGPDNIVLETDAPFLPPVPKRGMRNEPSYLHYIAQKVALILDVSTEEIAEITTKNAELLFSAK